jgi:hypothetical protein
MSDNLGYRTCGWSAPSRSRWRDHLSQSADHAFKSSSKDRGLSRFVDRRAVELEVVEVLGGRRFGDGELVFDRARLLLVDLGGEQIADEIICRLPSASLRRMRPFAAGSTQSLRGRRCARYRRKFRRRGSWRNFRIAIR